MSRRRAQRAAATVARREGPVGGYVREDDAVVCARCGHRLPVYAGRHLRQVHDAACRQGAVRSGS